MNYRLWLNEKNGFFMKMYGLPLENLPILADSIEKGYKSAGFTKPILIMPKGLTHAKIKEAFQKIGLDYFFKEELDNPEKFTHERWPDKDSYYIYHGGHRESVEGDNGLKLFSAEEIWQKKIKTMTSLEIGNFAFQYFCINGTSIDRKTITLASGSRCHNGKILISYSNNGNLYSGFTKLSEMQDGMRSREVFCFDS